MTSCLPHCRRHTSTQVILRPERNAQINAFTRLHKIKWPLCAEALQISRLGYKFVFRFMAGHNLSRRARAAVFPRSEIATPNGAQEQMPGSQCLGCEGERGETERRDGFPSFTFRIFNVRREGSESGPEPGEREGARCLPSLQINQLYVGSKPLISEQENGLAIKLERGRIHCLSSLYIPWLLHFCPHLYLSVRSQGSNTGC